MVKLLSFTLLLGVFMAAGCAGSSSGNKANIPSPNNYTTEVGVATDFDFKEKTRRILDKYQYEIVRFEESSDMIYFETRWKDRYPFEDEDQLGISQARSRFILEARPRTRGIRGSVKVFRITVIAENEALYLGSEEWQHVPMTSSYKKYVKRFAEDLRSEFRSGIRRF